MPNWNVMPSASMVPKRSRACSAIYTPRQMKNDAIAKALNFEITLLDVRDLPKR